MLSRALKRINRDIQELNKCPALGIGVTKSFPDNDLNYTVNIKVLSGIYADILFQLEMIIPNTYPMNPPKMVILPNQPFDNVFHHHIYPSEKGYKQFCIDLLADAIMDSKAIGSGWSSAYTFRTIFLQVQNFLSDPDGARPSKERIEWLKSEMKKYTMSFTTDEGKKMIHTWENPYPSICMNETLELEEKGEVNITNTTNNTNTTNTTNDTFKETESGISKINISSDENSLKNLKLFNIQMERLTCFLNKTNPVNDKNIILG